MNRPGRRKMCKNWSNSQHIKVLDLLPDDVLILIFKNLEPEELCRLCFVCKRFNQIASNDSIWLQYSKDCLFVGNLSNSSRRKTSSKEIYRITSNWKSKKVKEICLARHRVRLLPWIQKQDDDIWFSTGNVIRSFHIRPSGYIKEDRERSTPSMEQDATRFVIKHDMLVSGCRDGSVYGWDTLGRPLFCHKHVHSNDTQCVDFSKNVVVTGSRDTTCKVMPIHTSSNTSHTQTRSFQAGERVWSLKIAPCGRQFAAGLAGCFDDPPTILWDIESGQCVSQLSVNHRRGAGVLDMKFESPHELLTCGYDTFMRLWDLRTNTCVASWEEMYDSALYCLDTNGANAIAVGTARHGMVRLWDKRSSEAVQGYYSGGHSSPVYSLAMDYGHLYLALDLGLHVMDFTI